MAATNKNSAPFLPAPTVLFAKCLGKGLESRGLVSRDLALWNFSFGGTGGSSLMISASPRMWGRPVSSTVDEWKTVAAMDPRSLAASTPVQTTLESC